MIQQPEVIIKIGQAIANPYRLQICNIVMGSKKNLNISELQKRLNISYQNLLNNLKVLNASGLVELDKQEHLQGKPVIVKPTATLLRLG